MSLELKNWDIQEHLTTQEERKAYLEAALEEAGNDPAYISLILGDLAKSYGMSKLAEETGLTREGLYKSFSKNGNPSFITVSKVAQALGLKVQLQLAV